MASLRDRSWLPSFSTSILQPAFNDFQKLTNTDDLALLHSPGNWKDLEGALCQDISIDLEVKASHNKMVMIAIHLNN